MRGLFINLDEAVERREQIIGHLRELGLEQTYQRFSARRGDPSEAGARNLNTGELGLWKSWLELLEEQVGAAEANEFDYLHILEDDAELSSLLPVFLQGLGPERNDFDLLFTEMYASPAYWMKMTKEVELIRKSNKIVLHRKDYNGCTSSILVPKKRVTFIQEILSKCFQRTTELLPLDNYLRSLYCNQKISIACTLPYLSAVRVDKIRNSTIKNDQSHLMKLTQELNALLRRHLSVLKDDKTGTSVNEAILRLITAHQSDHFSEKLIKAGLGIVIDDQLCRYKLDPRLKGQPNNPQA